MWDAARIGLAAAAVLTSAACDRLALEPQKAAGAPAPVVAAETPSPVIRESAGDTFSDFVANVGAAYEPDALGLNAADRARLWRAMASSADGQIVTGGGAEALVFRGCAAESCDAGVAIVAIDTSTGAVFAGVRDVGGADVLIPNDRIEALLRLSSRSRGWDDPALAQTAAVETARP